MASSVDRDGGETRPLQKRVWYRTTLFNAFVIGGVGFLAPGLWNAMGSLGAGGAQSPFLVNAANSLVFGLMQGYIPTIAIAGLFWASEGAVALGYPEASKRGKYMNGANQKKKGKVGYETYLVFIALQCIAAPLALFLTPPEKVQRSDGTKVKIVAEKSFIAEIKALGRALARRDTYYFGVRARALSGFVTSEQEGLTIFSFYWVIFWHLVAWIYAWVIQEKYTRHPPAWDWEDSGFVEGFFVLAFWPRFTGILRGQESFSQAVSYGLNTREWKGGRVPLAVNTILLGLAVVPTWIAMREHVPVESDKSYGFEGQSDEEVPSERILTTQTSKVVAVQSTVQR
ncbi:UNC93-like protein [Lachnellula cervina]|uniref:UNC93-like protein n=1 Tax=Lachnellula cervina TaxID=1316786 RepID=A0A7D8USX0_9HELO|nr:UNC93-like protein [Lachnellula cervina]